MNISIDSSNPTFARSLLGRRMLVGFAVLLTFGSGLWLELIHQLEGATEAGAPPFVLHWLRDSSLALPAVLVAVFMGAGLARGLLDQYETSAGQLLAAAMVAVVMALYASVVMAMGNPIHGLLFAAPHAHNGPDLPLAVHVVRDGLLALSANEILAVGAVAVIFTRRVAGRATPVTHALRPV